MSYTLKTSVFVKVGGKKVIIRSDSDRLDEEIALLSKEQVADLEAAGVLVKGKDTKAARAAPPTKGGKGKKAGAETLVAGAGADTITGGAGADTITGGAGADEEEEDDE